MSSGNLPEIFPDPLDKQTCFEVVVDRNVIIGSNMEHLNLEQYRSVTIADIKARDAIDHGLHLQAKTWVRLSTFEQQLMTQGQGSLLYHTAVLHHEGSSLRILGKQLTPDVATHPAQVLAKLFDYMDIPRLSQQEATSRLWQDQDFRAKNAQVAKDNWEDEEFRKRQSEGRRRQWDDGEFRRRNVDAIRNVWWQEAERRRLEPEKVSKHNLRAIHGYRQDIGFYAQSMWEANIARVLLHLGRFFSPSERIRLNTTDMDLDFVVKDPRGNLVLYDIVAHPQKDPDRVSTNQAKLELLKQQYPEIRVHPITARFYYRLQKRFSQSINNDPNLIGWETAKDNLRTNADKYAHQADRPTAINRQAADEVRLQFQAIQSRQEGSKEQAVKEADQITKRQALIERLRRVVSGEEDIREISPIELYQAGMISQDSLRKQTVSLRAYLQTRGIKLEDRLYQLLHSTLSAEIPNSIIYLKTVSRSSYRINASPGDAEIEAISRLVEELKRIRYLKRTDDEIKLYQQKLLRKKDDQGNWATISLDEAILEIIRGLTPRMLRISYHEKQFFIDDIIGDTMEFLVPYFSGERGDFASFDRLFRFAYVVAQHKLFKQGRRFRSEFPIGERTDLFERGEKRMDQTDLFWPDELNRQLASLPSQSVAILRFNRMGINTKTIAEVIGISEARTKEIIYESLNALNPDRKRKRVGSSNQHFDLAVALADYQKLRVSSLEKQQRLPTAPDLVEARKLGEIQFGVTAYSGQLGQGSWKKAQQELERILSS